uniref:Uncharacterized protein n=1 Tax=Cacopsylla melanoneura TaxID=428564 RepID=A0A8D8WMZ6_9HEMI
MTTPPTHPLTPWNIPQTRGKEIMISRMEVKVLNRTMISRMAVQVLNQTNRLELVLQIRPENMLLNQIPNTTSPPINKWTHFWTAPCSVPIRNLSPSRNHSGQIILILWMRQPC